MPNITPLHQPKKHILLVNFGGPEKEEQVQNFLYQIFSDTDAIQMPIPHFGQKILAKIISWRRSPSVQKKYRHINYSPLNSITANLTEQINQSQLFTADYALRYGSPSIFTALEKMYQEQKIPDYIISLYPHYSYATTFSLENKIQEISRQFFRNNRKSPHFMRNWFSHPELINIFTKHIAQVQQNIPAHEKCLYLFCAHGIPISYVKNGDPYPYQIRQQVSIITNQIPLENHELAWQSRVGPNKWLEPNCHTIVKKYAQQNFSHLVAIPLSFVCDNLETLWDLDVELQKTALTSGFKTYTRIKMPTEAPEFINLLLNMCHCN